MFVRKSKSGFTLVEILIVVIILGILAAIVIPQFTNASQDAKNSSVVSQLQTLRSQIELFKLQHSDKLPDIITDWTPLTTVTNNADTGNVAKGPYLQSPMKNALNGKSNVVKGTNAAAASAACGFVYDADFSTNPPTGTGKIWATTADGTTIYVE